MWRGKERVCKFVFSGLLAIAGGVTGCSDPGSGHEPPGMMTPPPPEPPKLAWQRTLMPTAALELAPRARGWSVVRGIIHLHSPHSHDACDNNPQPGGQLNAPCLAHLRLGLCQTRQDFAMLTDHAGHMTEVPFESLVLTDAAAGDEPVRERGTVIGNSLRCDDGVAPGQRVLLTAGGENQLMPVGLHRHLGDTPDERAANMKAESPAAVQAFHNAGGAVLLPHGESRSLELIKTLAAGGLDGMEVYNLHANIDPTIRSTYLGLEALGAVAGLAPWLPATPIEEGGPEPDLAMLGFLLPNPNQLGKFDALLGLGRHLLPMAGSDIHENSFKQLLADGERGDSYRRLMRWFGNHLLVPKGQPLTPVLLNEAVRSGRGYTVFHLFGPPESFDFYAEPGAAGQPIGELGDTVTVGAKLHLVAPRPLPKDDRRAEPVLRLTLLRVAPGASSAQVVQTRLWSAAELQAGAATFVVDTATAGPGAYRAEVTVIPRHLVHLVAANNPTDGAVYLHEFPYLYSGVIYVEAAQPLGHTARRGAAAQ